SQSVLARQRPSILFVLPLPLLFVAIGVGGLWAVWRAPGDKKAGPISSAGANRNGTCLGLLLFGIFFLVGLGVLAFMAGNVRKALAAREWTPVDAVVVSSNVRTHRGNKSTTYSANVLYAYRVGGREYRSNRYGFLTGSSSGYE